MEPGLVNACRKAGLKSGGGLLFIAAIIGIRIVTATPDGVEAEIAKLEQVELEIAAEGASAAPYTEPEAALPAEGDSLVSRLGASVRGHLSGSEEASPNADRLVSCSLAGRIHFMRGADCATRGGRSTDFD